VHIIKIRDGGEIWHGRDDFTPFGAMCRP